MSSLKKEENTVSAYLADSNSLRNLSFCIQKDRILEKYPNSIFPKKGQSLSEYIDYLLSHFPSKMTENGYIKECLEYLCAQEHHDYVSCTKELYPIVGKRKAVNPNKIERSIRYVLAETEGFFIIPNHLKTEIFSVPNGIIPKNFYFLCDIVEYIKSHYFLEKDIFFTPEQEEYIMSKVKPEDDAFSIIEMADMRKEVKHFLYNKLGYFSFQTTPANQMIVDAIICFVTSNINTVRDFYFCKEFINKWEFGQGFEEYDRFYQKIVNLRFSIENAYKSGKIDFAVYQQIFGDCELHMASWPYISKIADYLKEKKENISIYLEDSTLARQVSFCIQKDRILEKYPNGIFPKKSQSLSEYIDDLLSYFPSRMTENGYIKECLEYLCAQKHHDYVKCVEELYLIVGKRKAVNASKIERSIRYFISEEYLNIPNYLRTEIFSAPDEEIPANFYFLCDIVEYIKAHYFGEQEMSFTSEEKKYIMSHLKSNDNAFSIMKNAKIRKEVKHFLYDKLGHFSFQTTPANQMIVDAIICFATSNINNVRDLYLCKEFREKWEFGKDDNEYARFQQKIINLRFTIETAYKYGKIDFAVYQQIFGDCKLHMGSKRYISRIADYLRKEEITRSLKRSIPA